MQASAGDRTGGAFIADADPALAKPDERLPCLVGQEVVLPGDQHRHVLDARGLHAVELHVMLELRHRKPRFHAPVLRKPATERQAGLGIVTDARSEGPREHAVAAFRRYVAVADRAIEARRAEILRLRGGDARKRQCAGDKGQWQGSASISLPRA